MSTRNDAAIGLISAMLVATALMGCGGTVKGAEVPSAVAASTAAEIDAPEPAEDFTATLDIQSAQPTPILLDGKPIGTTPIVRYQIAPGPHDVTFVDKAHGNRTMGVSIEPGEAKMVKMDSPPTPIEADHPGKN